LPPSSSRRWANVFGLSGALSFFGNAAGAAEVYWAFLVWLYAAPAAPHLRQAAVPVGIDPWVYPVYAVLFGRSSGGKTCSPRSRRVRG
jgi:hypothetical protein